MQMTALEDRNVLVVEDEFIVAEDMAEALREAGARVLGPVATVQAALDLIEGAGALDGALLDVNLQGEKSYPVAGLLRQRGVPFVFLTGYDRTSIDPAYADAPLCEKPVDLRRAAAALF